MAERLFRTVLAASLFLIVAGLLLTTFSLFSPSWQASFFFFSLPRPLPIFDPNLEQLAFLLVFMRAMSPRKRRGIVPGRQVAK